MPPQERQEGVGPADRETLRLLEAQIQYLLSVYDKMQRKIEEEGSESDD